MVTLLKCHVRRICCWTSWWRSRWTRRPWKSCAQSRCQTSWMPLRWVLLAICCIENVPDHKPIPPHPHLPELVPVQEYLKDEYEYDDMDVDDDEDDDN